MKIIITSIISVVVITLVILSFNGSSKQISADNSIGEDLGDIGSATLHKYIDKDGICYIFDSNWDAAGVSISCIPNSK